MDHYATEDEGRKLCEAKKIEENTRQLIVIEHRDPFMKCCVVPRPHY